MAVGGLVAVVAPVAPAAAVPAPQITTWSAPIDNPASVTVGSDGAIWVVNRDTRSVGSVRPSGEWHVYPDGRLDGLSDVAAGPDGALWATYTGDLGVAGTGGVARIAVDGSISVFPTPTLAHPQAITAGSDGALWFVAGNGGIGRMTVDGSFVGEGVSVGTSVADMVTGPDGALWFSGGDDVKRYAIGGAVTSMGGGGSGAIVVGPDHALWFAGSFGLGRLTTAGVFTAFPTPTPPVRVAAGEDGNLWYAGPLGGGQVTPAGVVTMVALDDPRPSGVVQLPGGSMWVVDRTHAVSIDATGITGRIVPPVDDIAALAALPGSAITISNRSGGWSTAAADGVGGYPPLPGMTQNLGMVVDGRSVLWVLDGPHSIGRRTNGRYAHFTSSQISYPEHILIGPDGHVWIVNHGGGLLRIENDGRVGRRIAVRPMKGIVVGSDGAFWFTAGSTFGRVTLAGVVTEWSDAGFGQAGAMVRDLDGIIWFVDGAALGRVAADGTVTHVPLASLNGLDGLAVGTDGALWFTDSARMRVGRRSPSGKLQYWGVGFPATEIAPGGDGAMWFAAPTRLGRITTPMAPIRATISVGSVSAVEADNWMNGVRIPVTMSRPMPTPVSGGVAMAPGDPAFRPRQQGFVLQPGETSASVQLDVAGDALPNANRVFTVQLARHQYNIDLQQRQGTVTAVDDDGPDWNGVEVGDVRIVDGRLGMRSVPVPLTLTRPQSAPVSVSWVAVPIDGPVPGFVGGAGTVVIPAGAAAASIPVPVGPTWVPTRGRRFAVWITASGAPVGRAQGIVQIVN